MLLLSVWTADVSCKEVCLTATASVIKGMGLGQLKSAVWFYHECAVHANFAVLQILIEFWVSQQKNQYTVKLNVTQFRS